MFFPIDQSTCLLFYDPNIYKIGKFLDGFRRVIKIKSESEITKINKLQVINANNAIYFNENISQEYIKKLIEQTKTNRKKGKIKVGQIDLPTELNNSLFSFSIDEKADLKLSFIQEKQKVKEKEINNYSTLIRNPELIEKIENK